MESGLSQQEQLAKAREERANIVFRYDRGREDGAIIEPWEDPNFELYLKTDRYGFIHDSQLPDTKTRDEAKRLEAEKSRSMKWAKMISNWSKYKDTEKIVKRIYKGIPLSVRGRVWSNILGLEIVKQQQKGKYEEMKLIGRKWSTDVRQIDLDVNRTYRDHEFFRLRYNTRQQQLFNVLVAFSMYNQEIGYCQGMSQIAALLLIYLNEEEDAFWALSALMADEKFSMHGFFIPGFPKLMRFQKHHDKILDKFLPRLKKHLEKNYIDAGLYTLKWFFQCFLDRVPFSLTLRLWDIYLLEGEKLLLSMAYTILKMHRRQIMRLDMDQILDYIQKRLQANFGYDDDYVIESLEKNMDELKRAKLLCPGPPPEIELPQKPFGLFVEPTIEKEVGLRGAPSAEEKRITQELVERHDSLAINGATLCVDRGSQNSLDKSIDEVSSLGGVGGSRISLANTSLTSAADLSTWSSTKKFDSDSIQSARSLMSSDAKSIQSVRSPRSPTEYKFRRSSITQSPAQSPKKVFNRQSTHSEGGHNDVFDSPSQSPLATPRPSRLSVSQTTLREGDNMVSEPATPKASETPDTVRIFVPYSPSAEGDSTLLPSPLSEREPPSPSPYNGDGSGIIQGCDPNRIKIQVDGDSSYSDLPSPQELSFTSSKYLFFTQHSAESTFHSNSTRTCKIETISTTKLEEFKESSFISSSYKEIINNSEGQSFFQDSHRPKQWTSKPITLDSPEFEEGLL